MANAASEPCTRDAIAALERILSSPPFKRSARLCAFLRFIAEERLAGREEPLKEYELGVRIFQRPEGYDPQADPLVRVQARQLRFKLREYYETAGAVDPIRIELPKGSYLPVFHYAPESSVPTSAEPSGESVVEQRTAAPAARPRVLLSRRFIPVAIAILAFVAFLFAWNHPWRAHTRPASGSPNPEARDLYLKGRYYWNKRSPESLHTAVDYFTQAIVRDPNYAQAYVGLADSYNLLREFAAMPPEEAFQRATVAAQRAVALDDTSAEAHASLAFCLFWGSWDINAGIREFKRALRLNPNYAPAHHWYATALLTLGRAHEALAEIERARDLDSTSPAIMADKGLMLFYAGEPEQAIILLKQIESADPSFLSPHTYLKEIYLARRDFPNFLAEFQTAARLSGDAPALSVAAAAQAGLAAGGPNGMFENKLERQQQLYREGKEPAYLVARTCSLLGNRAQTLKYLEAALDKREASMLDIRLDFVFLNLHNDASWRSLVARVGLPPE